MRSDPRVRPQTTAFLSLSSTSSRRLGAGGKLRLRMPQESVDGAVINLHNTAVGQEWPAPELQSDWWIGIPQETTNVRLRKSQRTFVSALRILEAHGIREIAPDWIDSRIPVTLPPAVVQSVQILYKLGIDWARSIDRPPTRRGSDALPIPRWRLIRLRQTPSALGRESQGEVPEAVARRCRRAAPIRLARRNLP